MKSLWIFEGFFVALAFDRLNVQEQRLVLLLGPFKGLDQLGQVMPINRADVAQAKFLEQHAGHQ